MNYNCFSPNMLKTYETCPKKFYYRYIETLNVPVSSLPFEKGKKIHALANYFLKGVNISRIETCLSENESEVWQSLLENPFFKKECFQSEYQLSCKIDKYWVGGRLDAIVHDYEKYYILDYKTGSIPKNPKFDYQTMVYLLCLDKFLKTYDSLSFVYINLKDKQNYVIEYDQNLKSQYEEKLISICNKISSDNLYDTVNSNCKSCEFNKFCH